MLSLWELTDIALDWLIPPELYFRSYRDMCQVLSNFHVNFLCLGPKVGGGIDVGGAAKGPELEADLSGGAKGMYFV